MERVTIQEASYRLNLAQAEIRRYIREGRLKATREGGPRDRTWMVEMPGEGWLDDDKARFHEMASGMPLWWWPVESRTGNIHYIVDVGIEETVPVFLCGLESENLWAVQDELSDDKCCPACLQRVKDEGLPLGLD
ncbi:MAG: hypothetical protein OXN21_13730 [Chloroflexota bacterium]|nr:hypothetical protein [Chloroflexota bacterium]